MREASRFRRRRITPSVFLQLTCLAFLATFTAARVHAPLAKAAENSHDDGDKGGVSLERISTFISLATSYLVRISHTQEQDPVYPGKFTYIATLGENLEFDFDQNPQDDYNLLRHNGAIYSLALSYARQENDQVLEAMTRAVGFLKREALGPVPDMSKIPSSDVKEIGDDENESSDDASYMSNLLAAWENEAVIPGNKHDTAKLGGAGLALVALVSLEQIAPGSTELEYMRKVGRFIAYLQHDDGSFTCRYVPDKGGRVDTHVSLYYPGEAALGLLYLASIEVDESYRQQWIDVTTDALLYLERHRRLQKLEDVEADHWALLATAKLLPLLDENRKEYQLVYEHGVKVVKSMLSEYSKADFEESGGCMTLDRTTCPTSTRLEGLIAALSFLRPEERFIGYHEEYVENLLERMERDIRIGINFLLDSQERDATFNMHGGVPTKYPVHKKSDKEVRVDYVQHSMSAVIAYERVLRSRMSGNEHGLLQFRTTEKGAFLSRSMVLFGQGLWRLSIYLAVLFVAAAGVVAMSRKPTDKVKGSE